MPLLNRAHEKILSRKLKDDDLPYVTSINFHELTKVKETIVGKPILCSSCKAALMDPKAVKTDPKIGYYFVCEFCGTVNIVDPKDLPKGPWTDIDFIIEPKKEPSDITKLKITGDFIMSVIDISGSMGDGKLEAVKRSLAETVRDLKVNSPGSTFSLITFESEVRLLSHKGKELLKFSGNILHNKKGIVKEFEKVDMDFVPISDTADKWINMINKMVPMDMTALGPALLGGITLLVRTGVGGRLILLTDGMANQGLGNLETPTSSGKNFYKEMASICHQHNIIIEVVGVQSQEGASELGLDVLGRLADSTGGDIYFVTRDELENAFEKMRSVDYVAKNVSVNIIAPRKKLKLRNVSGVVAPKAAGPVEVGAVTKDREIFYEMETIDDIKEEVVPIQTQIKYKDKEGNTHLRIINEKIKITNDDKEFKKKYNLDLTTTYNVQMAGEAYYKSDVKTAKKRLKTYQTQIKGLGIAGMAPAAEISENIAHLDEEIEMLEEEEDRIKEFKGKKSARAKFAQEMKRRQTK
ncbi:MAG: vWA domain-containing protein [Candidatus Helarchaeota archaeon]